MKHKNILLILPLLLLWQNTFSQKTEKKQLVRKINISNLYIIRPDTSYLGRIMVDDSRQFFCYNTSIDSFMFAIDSSVIFTKVNDIGGYHYDVNDNLTYWAVDPKKGSKQPDFWVYKYHKDTNRVDTVISALSMHKQVAQRDKNDSKGCLPNISTENAYLQSVFGYDIDSADARIIVPECLFEKEHDGFYNLKIYKCPNGKIKLVSNYGCVEYPRGFVVKDTIVYKKLGIQGYRKVRFSGKNREMEYEERSMSIDKIVGSMLDNTKITTDSVLVESLYPYYLQINGHYFFISSDNIPHDSQSEHVFMLCEYLRYINHTKRNCWKFIKQPYNR